MVEQRDAGNQEQYPETSLVDLAKIVVRRRRIFYGTFCLIFLAGLVFALLSETRFRYTTIYSVGQPEKVGSKELLDVLISDLENRLLPQLKEAFVEDNGRKLPFDFSVRTSAHDSVLIINSDANQAHSGLVLDTHKSIAQELRKREERFLSLARVQLESRLEGINALIDRLQEVDDSGLPLADALANRTDIQVKLSSERKGEVIAIARESLDKVSGSRALIGVITVMFALVMGVLAAFFGEFVVKVRESLQSGREGSN
jgi:hypothetical protein